MKYVIVLGDGMSGLPLQELGGRTTLEAAHTPVCRRAWSRDRMLPIFLCWAAIPGNVTPAEPLWKP